MAIASAEILPRAISCRSSASVKSLYATWASRRAIICGADVLDQLVVLGLHLCANHFRRIVPCLADAPVENLYGFSESNLGFVELREFFAAHVSAGGVGVTEEFGGLTIDRALLFKSATVQESMVNLIDPVLVIGSLCLER